MMDYTMFKELVNDKFMDYMPEKYRNGTLSIRKVNKINGSKDGLSILQKGEQGAPTIYVDDMYERFKQSDGLEATIKEFPACCKADVTGDIRDAYGRRRHAKGCCGAGS